jgi:hypothetical protein
MKGEKGWLTASLFLPPENFGIIYSLEIPNSP